MSYQFVLSTEAACRIVVNGEIDTGTAPEFAAAIPDAGSVWIDFSEVTFLDSAGVGVLVAAHRAAHERGDHLHVSGLQGGPLEVFHITALYDVLCG